MFQKLIIDLDGLNENIKAIQKAVEVPVIAVVKCNGYGLGTGRLCEICYEAGLRFFAVSDAAEAFEIRDAGIKDADILMLTPVYDRDTINELVRNDVILTVSNLNSAKRICETCDKPVRVHVKVDTGMGRFGFREQELDDLIKIYDMDGLLPEGIFSHFAASFEKKYDKTGRQLERFQSVLKFLDSKKIKYGIAHIANSTASLRFPETRLSAVRIGSGLLGRLSYPALNLKKIGKMEAEITDIVSLKKGDSLGYAGVCRVKEDTTAAVVALGSQWGYGVEKSNDLFRPIDILRYMYQDFRSLHKKRYVDFSGKKLSVIGRIGTHFTLVDLAGNQAFCGDKITAEVNPMFVDSRVTREIR